MGVRSLLRCTVVSACVLGSVLLGAAHAEEAKAKPDATIDLESTALAAGIGFSWGSGTLTYKGKEYPISVEGLTIGDVGVSRIEASGRVYNLKKLSDFDGNYTAVVAGATMAGGGGAAAMRNQNGVDVELIATTQGVKFALGGGGVKMKLKQ